LKKLYLIFILSSVLFLSCKTVKPIKYGRTVNINLEKLIKKIEKHNFSAHNYSSRFEVKFNNQNQDFTGRGKIKILKDSMIWGSINFMGIPAAKFLLTPHRIQYYNKVDQTYYDGDYQIVYNLTGTNLSFRNIQNLLFANPINPINIEDYQLKINSSSYSLNSKTAHHLIPVIQIIPNYKIRKLEINPLPGQKLSVIYPGFIKIGRQILPNDIYIHSKGMADDLSVKIKLKNQRINQKQTYPFKIPEGYQKL